MARGKKKEKELTPEEKLQQALVPVGEQPYMVPENWRWVKFGSLSIEMADGPFGSNLKTEHYTAKKEARIIQLSNIGENGWREENTKYTTYNHAEEIARSIVEPGNIVIAKMMPAGRAIICPNHEKMYILSSDAVKMVPHELLNSDYLVYGINSFFFRNQVQENTQGITRARTSIKKLKEYYFPLAPLPEQQRIVDRIESLFAKLDEAKEKAQAVVDGFEDRKAAILHKAFTGELTSIKNADSINYVLSEIHKWSVTFPAKDIKAIEKEQEKASIICLPDGRNWIKCTVGAIGRVTNGSTPSRKCSDYWNGNIPWVSSGEVRNNTIYITNECITQKGFDNSSVKLLPKGTILIAMIGEGKTRGQSAILEIEATINQNIAAIVIDHGLVEPEFLWFWFQMNYKKNREKGSGSGPQALNCQRVRELDCICPSIKEQREIVTLLRALILKEEQVNENAEHVIELIDNIKKSILARAFRGELGTNDPTDESAEKLLKRILI